MWIWISVIFVLVFLGLQLIDDGLSSLRGGDEALYLLLSKAIATGQGYTDIHIPGHPPHTQYPPPLFPLVLSPIFYLFGYNFTWMRLVIIGFTIGSFFLVRDLVKRLEGGSELPGIMIGLLFITNFGILVFSREILPEMQYIFFSLLAINSAEAFKERDDLVPYVLYLPFLLALAYMTKNHGITLYLAMLAVLILRLFQKGGKRGRHFLQLFFFGAATIAPFILWILRSAHMSSSPHFAFRSVYIFNVLENFYNLGSEVLIERVWNNLGMLLVAIPGSFLTFLDLQKILPGPVFNSISIFLFLTILAGFIYRLACERGVMEFYVIFYLSIIMVWPVYGLGDARRYMIPLVALFYYYSFTGFNLILSLKDIRMALRPGTMPLRFKGLIVIPFALFLALNIVEIREMFTPGTAAERVSRSVTLVNRDIFLRVDEMRPEAVLRETFKETSPCYYNYLVSAFTLSPYNGEICSEVPLYGQKEGD
jgi:hypothetical protein